MFRVPSDTIDTGGGSGDMAVSCSVLGGGELKSAKVKVKVKRE
jgi:hypothetical protein